MTDTITSQTRISVTRLAGNIGAEIGGIDTGGTLSDDEVAAGPPGAARSQGGLPARPEPRLRPAGRVRRAARPAHARPPDAGVAAGPAATWRKSTPAKGVRANHWHTDVTFVDRPPAFTLLHAVVIPPVGGDTLWANTVTAYESLPGDLRDLADQLRVVHTNDYDYAARDGRDESRRRDGRGAAQGVRLHRLRDRAPGRPGASRRPASARWCSAASRAPSPGSSRRRPHAT